MLLSVADWICESGFCDWRQGAALAVRLDIRPRQDTGKPACGYLCGETARHAGHAVGETCGNTFLTAVQKELHPRNSVDSGPHSLWIRKLFEEMCSKPAPETRMGTTSGMKRNVRGAD